MNRIGFLALLTILGGILPGSRASASDPPLHILTTIPAVYCYTANVVRDLAVVENLLPPGAEAHDFQFTSAARRRLEQADLVIASGLNLESWLDKAVSKSVQLHIVHCADGMGSWLIPADGALPNPHVWLDPMLACRMVTNILNALSQADPAHAGAFTSNAIVFVTRLEALDAEIATGLSTLTHRAIITYHDAFPYLARRYGLSIAGVVEERAGTELSPAHLTALRAAIRQDDVKALFVDPQEGTRRARQLARDFKITLGLLETLESAPLNTSSYEDGMRRNLRSLQEALK